MTKTIPDKKKCKKAKWLSEEALQTAEKRRDMKGKRERERYTHLNAENNKEREEKLSKLSTGKTIEWEGLAMSPRKLEIPREHFMQRWAQ